MPTESQWMPTESQPKVNRKSIESQPKANGCQPKVIINRESFALLPCCNVAFFVLLAYSPRKSKIFFVLIPLFYIFAGEIENIGNKDHLDPLEILDHLEKSRSSRKSRKSRSSIPSNPKTNKKPSSCHFLSTLLFPRSRR